MRARALGEGLATVQAAGRLASPYFAPEDEVTALQRTELERLKQFLAARGTFLPEVWGRQASACNHLTPVISYVAF